MNITSVFSRKSKIQLLFEKILEYCKNEILKDRIINIPNLITNNKKVTKLETGLPGKPINQASPSFGSSDLRTAPNARGLPGLIAICQRSNLPSAVTAGLM